MANQEFMQQLQATIRASMAGLQSELSEQMKATTEQVTTLQRNIEAVTDRMGQLEMKIEADKQVNKTEEISPKPKEDVTKTVTESDTSKKDAKLDTKETKKFDFKSLEVDTTGAQPAKPPEFDGTGNWSLYKTQFEAASALNGWDDKRKATEMVVALRGSAVNVLQSIPSCQLQDYEVLLEALETRYGDRHLQGTYRAQLRTRTQLPGESLQEFAGEIENLGLLAYPDLPRQVVEQLIVDAFIDGIYDTESRQTVCLTNSETLKDALSCALRVDAVRRRPAGHHRRSDYPSCGFSPQQPQQQQQQQQRSQRGPPTCWTCGEQGHTKWNCPQKDN